MHHADACGNGGTRLAGWQHLACNTDTALIRRVMAEQDVHQCGLASPVLTQKGQHLAACQRDGDCIIGQRIAKAFADLIDLQYWHHSRLVGQALQPLRYSRYDNQEGSSMFNGTSKVPALISARRASIASTASAGGTLSV